MSDIPESPTGQQLRDEGQAAVIAADTAVHRMAGEHIRKSIDTLADKGKEFTAEDVRKALPEEFRAHSDNLLPAYIGGAAHAGRIKAVGWDTCTRPERRGGPMRRWIGAAHAQESAA